jgi:hypothetical protein
MNSAIANCSTKPEVSSFSPFCRTTASTSRSGSTSQPSRSPGASDLLAVPVYHTLPPGRSRCRSKPAIESRGSADAWAAVLDKPPRWRTSARLCG